MSFLPVMFGVVWRSDLELNLPPANHGTSLAICLSIVPILPRCLTYSRSKKGCSKHCFNEFVHLSSDILSFDLFYYLFTMGILYEHISKRY